MGDMRYKAVYFKGLSNTGLPYHKALVYEADVPWFLEKGAVAEQPTEVPKPVVAVAKPKAKAPIRKVVKSGKKS